MNTPMPLEATIRCIKVKDSAYLRRAVLLSALALLAFSLSARAVSPPPDGWYPSQNTAEGHRALFHLQLPSTVNDTGLGYNALFSTTTGSVNTATGAYAAPGNTTGLYNTATGAYTLYTKTTGNSNTATGSDALGFVFSG